MADVSACDGSDGSSLTVSGPRPLRETEPRPTTEPEARPRHPGPAPPPSEPPTRIPARRSAGFPRRGPRDRHSPGRVGCPGAGGNVTPERHQ